MKPITLGKIFLVLILVSATYGANPEDDFSEFDDDFDEDPVAPKNTAEDDFDDEEDEFVHEPPKKKVEIDQEDQEAVVEDVDSEFNHFADEEEFEGLTFFSFYLNGVRRISISGFQNEEDEEDEFEHMTTKGRGAKEKVKPKPAQNKPPNSIKITNIPMHLRTNWESYYLEMLMIAGK